MQNISLEKKVAVQGRMIQEAGASYQLTKGLTSIGHLVAGIVTGAKVFDPSLNVAGYTYNWSVLDGGRIAVGAAALNEVKDAYKDAVKAARGLKVEDFMSAKVAGNEDLSDNQVLALPAQAQRDFRIVQGFKAIGRFASMVFCGQAAITGDYGVLGKHTSDLLALGVGAAGVQQGYEGCVAAKNVVTGI